MSGASTSSVGQHESHPAVTVAIPGTTQVRHVVDNIGATMGRMPDAAERRRQEAFLDSL